MDSQVTENSQALANAGAALQSLRYAQYVANTDGVLASKRDRMVNLSKTQSRHAVGGAALIEETAYQLRTIDGARVRHLHDVNVIDVKDEAFPFLLWLCDRETVPLPIGSLCLRKTLRQRVPAFQGCSDKAQLNKVESWLDRFQQLGWLAYENVETGCAQRPMLISVAVDLIMAAVAKCGVTPSDLQKLYRQWDRSDKPKDPKLDEVDMLLKSVSYKEDRARRSAERLTALLCTPSVRNMANQNRMRPSTTRTRHFCDYTTVEDCNAHGGTNTCTKYHFRRTIYANTELSRGDCMYYQGCFNSENRCRAVHYVLDESKVPKDLSLLGTPTNVVHLAKFQLPAPEFLRLPDYYQYPPQWIRCDMRTFRFDVLGKFGVVMADPAWVIHMDLPYGTMGDDEMKDLQVPQLQDEGFLFLWVTTRALELAREMFYKWGYTRVEELIWVKTNQLQRINRTGRTGHWINHSKEHCLVGVKGNPKGYNRLIDCDVVLAEVRETSRKPDEVYGMIERLFPGTRKVELFGRQHNTNPGWITLGNQLDGTRIVDPDLWQRFCKIYPSGKAVPD